MSQNVNWTWMCPHSEPILSADKSSLSTQDDDTILLTAKKVEFFEHSIVREILFHFLALCSGFVLYLVAYWYPQIHARVRYAKCAGTSPNAHLVLMCSLDDVYSIETIKGLVGGGQFPRWVPMSKVPSSSQPFLKMFEWRFERFWYEPQSQSWVRRAFATKIGFDAIHFKAVERACEELHHSEMTQVELLRVRRQLIYGLNTLDMKFKPIWLIFFLEWFSPFTIFQIFSVIVWYTQPYNVYATIILFLTVISVCQSTWDTHSANEGIRKLAIDNSTVIRVSFTSSPHFIRQEVIPSANLLPGDVVIIPSVPTVMPCDMVLKAPVPIEYNMGPGAHGEMNMGTTFQIGSARDSKYTLFAGTSSIQARPAATPPLSAKPHPDHPNHIWDMLMSMERGEINEFPVMAMVLRTGFGTAKGQLLRSIVFPKPSRFNMNKEIYKFFYFIVLALIIGCSVNIYLTRDGGLDGLTVFVKILNLITVIVSPALPLSLTVGVNVSYARMARARVACINPPRVIAAGTINCFCFDKTGTLTEDHLDLKGLSSVQKGKRGSAVASTPVSVERLLNPEPDDITASTMELILASCHGISALLTPEGVTSQMVGDPLELQMFESSGWTLSPRPVSKKQMENDHLWSNSRRLPPTTDTIVTSSRNNNRSSSDRTACGLPESCPLAIVKRFDFDSDLRRMSVIVAPLDGNGEEFYLFTKGAPEMLAPLCKGTIPNNYENELFKLTSDGFRVLSTAYRRITIGGKGSRDGEISFPSIGDMLSTTRAEFEDELTFAGFIVMENALKGATKRILAEIALSGLRQMMVTGDNVYTSIAVSRTCGPMFLSPNRKAIVLDVPNKSSDAAPVKNKQSNLNMSSSSASSSAYTRSDTDSNSPTYGETSMASNSYTAGSSASYTAENSASGSASYTTYSASSSTMERKKLAPINRPSAGKGGNQPQQAQIEEPLVTTGGIDMIRMSDASDPTRSISFMDFWTRDQSSSGSDDIAQFTSMIASSGYDMVVSGTAFAALWADHVRQKAKSLSVITPLESVLVRANVWARMSPSNKQELVSTLQEIGYCVCMTGDGANDSGALKTADIGISIAGAVEKTNDNTEVDESQNKKNKKKGDGAVSAAAAATIAAPFSTRIADISVVKTVILLGRAALVSSFSLFKFMFIYGMIQFIMVLIVYQAGTEVPEWQYVWFDLVCVFPQIFLIPLIEESDKLVVGRPVNRLISDAFVLGIGGLIIIVTIPHVVVATLLHKEPWYIEPAAFSGFNDVPPSDDSTVLFMVSQFMYIGVGMATAQGFGLFRKNLWSSKLLVLFYMIMISIFTWYCFGPGENIRTAFAMSDLRASKRQTDFAGKTYAIAIGFALVAVLFERFIVPHKTADKPTVDIKRISKELQEAPSIAHEDWFVPIPRIPTKNRYDSVQIDTEKLMIDHS